MGLDAQCTVRVGRKTFSGTALLEGEVLIFRGDTTIRVPFDEMRGVRVEGPTMLVQTADQELTFELGPVVAERWMRLIKEPKSLFEKLEVEPSSRVAVVDINDSLFLTALRERTAGVAEGRVPEGVPTVFLGAETVDALRKVPLLRTRMMDAGVLWIVRPKGSKAISEAAVTEAVRASGLVETKVVSFSKTHTAHKCVIPLEMRGQPARPRPPILSIPPSSPMLQPRKPAAKPAPARPKAPSPGNPRARDDAPPARKKVQAGPAKAKGQKKAKSEKKKDKKKSKGGKKHKK